MSSCVHFSLRLKRLLNRSSVSSGKSSTRSSEMVSGLELRSNRAKPWMTKNTHIIHYIFIYIYNMCTHTHLCLCKCALCRFLCWLMSSPGADPVLCSFLQERSVAKLPGTLTGWTSQHFAGAVELWPYILCPHPVRTLPDHLMEMKKIRGPSIH